MRLVHSVLLTSILPCLAFGQPYTINTFAGRGLLVNVPGTSASIGQVNNVAVDSAGNVFIVALQYNLVLRLDAATNALTLVAGNGTPGFSGDNGPATSAQLNNPQTVAVDSAGNVYIADGLNNRIRKVSNGVITTVAGNGTSSSGSDNGDNGPATNAKLDCNGVAVDGKGNFYIADGRYPRIRKVSNGVITTIAGTGVQGFGGDNGLATNAQLNGPAEIAVDSAGNLYIADSGNHRIRTVSNGVITTVAGNGVQGSSGDNGPATNAQLNDPVGIAVDAGGSLYIADFSDRRVRKVANGVITTVAGNGTLGSSGDNGPAISAQLNEPDGVAVDGMGNLYIADFDSRSVRKVANGVINTVAGGSQSFGDNGPATSAQLYSPGVAADSVGNVYVADFGNNRFREISDGIITTVAGGGQSLVDNGPATNALFRGPYAVAVDSAANLYVTDAYNPLVRRVSNGLITTVAGNGSYGFSGDNGPATSASLFNYEGGVAIDSAGNLNIADSVNGRIRRVLNGVITTLAGNGSYGFSGDNGPATSANFTDPQGIAVDSAGSLYIADTHNNRIRKVSNGVITTVAGSGTVCISSVSPCGGFGGDNGPATSAQLNAPGGVAVDAAGNLYIADTSNNRIRRVSNGVITTIAGNGTPGFGGDNGPGQSAQLNFPTGVAVDPAGNVYIADQNNFRVRVLTPSGVPNVSLVANAFGDTPLIAPNTWVEIKGTNLAPPGDSRTWLGSDFVNNQMPTQLDGVSATVNGKRAFVYFISATQVNILTPPDAMSGPVQVQLTRGGVPSNVMTVQAQQDAPSFFVFDGSHVTGTHLDGSLLGPTSLYPGLSTPAKPGETVILYANGFGATSSPVASGALTQSGNLPVLPTVAIGGNPAAVQFAGLVSPGLFQFNVVVPASVPDGNNALSAMYSGFTTQTGVILVVQH